MVLLVVAPNGVAVELEANLMMMIAILDVIIPFLSLSSDNNYSSSLISDGSGGNTQPGNYGDGGGGCEYFC